MTRLEEGEHAEDQGEEALAAGGRALGRQNATTPGVLASRICTHVLYIQICIYTYVDNMCLYIERERREAYLSIPGPPKHPK